MNDRLARLGVPDGDTGDLVRLAIADEVTGAEAWDAPQPWGQVLLPDSRHFLGLPWLGLASHDSDVHDLPPSSSRRSWSRRPAPRWARDDAIRAAPGGGVRPTWIACSDSALRPNLPSATWQRGHGRC